MSAKLILKAGREKSLLRRHPWIFSGAVAELQGEAQAGDTLEVHSSHGEQLGLAAYSPQSSIRARMWAFGEQKEEELETLLREKVRAALEMRKDLHRHAEDNALRLVHAESDGLPGLIVDCYADWLVLQSLSWGAEKWKARWCEWLAEFSGIDNIYERSDADVRTLEGLPPVSGILRGQEVPDDIEIKENGLRFLVDIQKGHKTGFYLDQRDSRLKVQQYAGKKRVLNCFSYSGAFAIYCLAGGAGEVVSMDSSQDALEMGRRNLVLNGLPPQKASWLCVDVFQELRAMRDRRERFDLIILDPPRFAPTSAQVQAAARGYKDINLLAFKLLNPGGLLATFSCSGGLQRALFHKIVADAALDAGVTAHVLEMLSQAPDHAVALNFPEGEYLKGLILRIE